MRAKQCRGLCLKPDSDAALLHKRPTHASIVCTHSMRRAHMRIVVRVSGALDPADWRANGPVSMHACSVTTVAQLLADACGVCSLRARFVTRCHRVFADVTVSNVEPTVGLPCLRAGVESLRHIASQCGWQLRRTTHVPRAARWPDHVTQQKSQRRSSSHE